MKTKIFLDTNFLMIPAQFKVDIFAEIGRIFDSYELFAVAETVAELKNIIGSGTAKGKDKSAAKVALQLLKKYRVKIADNRKVFKSADEAILDIVDRNSAVATQDIHLKRKLKGRCGVIVLRKKQYLEFFE
ncbi:hypothetical protein HYX10_04035 [Candidatus Woesearchaeota archaeon]|nr:hypothetical protein [Candidatus Woesearchaeota archaeon]